MGDLNQEVCRQQSRGPDQLDVQVGIRVEDATAVSIHIDASQPAAREEGDRIASEFAAASIQCGAGRSDGCWRPAQSRDDGLKINEVDPTGFEIRAEGISTLDYAQSSAALKARSGHGLHLQTAFAIRSVIADILKRLLNRKQKLPR